MERFVFNFYNLRNVNKIQWFYQSFLAIISFYQQLFAVISRYTEVQPKIKKAVNHCDASHYGFLVAGEGLEPPTSGL